MPQWNSTNLSTLPISTQTDADSPVSQALMDKLRLFSEQLLVMGYQTGSSCAIATISTDTNTAITASSSGAADGEHDGRTILITTGLAKGNMYTIDATSSGATYKLTMTGDNLYADGVRDTDSFKILYDQLVNTDGHDHDGINSKVIPNLVQMVMSHPEIASDTGHIAKNWLQVKASTHFNSNLYQYVFKAPGMNTLHAKLQLVGLNPNTQGIRVNLGGVNVQNSATTSTGVWVTYTLEGNVSAVSSGWTYCSIYGYSSAFKIQIRSLGVYLTP